MRTELLGRSLALPLAGALFLVAGAPAAQEAACFPECRSGYLCHEGACISSCNPPCADDERCTAEGECAPKAQIVAPAEPPPPAEPPKPPYVPKGVVLGLTAGALLCASEGICDTGERDVGLAAMLRGGYRVLPWLIVDAEASIAPVVLKSAADIDTAILFSAGLGARFLPLARRHVVDPVLGLHVGYFLEWMKYEDSAETSIAKLWFHGVHLAYSAGMNINLSPVFSLGIALDVFEPFRASQCVAVEASEGNPFAGTQSQPASTQCTKPTTTNHPFYLGVGLTGTFLI